MIPPHENVLTLSASLPMEQYGKQELLSLSTLLDKCGESLTNGRRIRNVAWRSWGVSSNKPGQLIREIYQSPSSFESAESRKAKRGEGRWGRHQPLPTPSTEDESESRRIPPPSVTPSSPLLARTGLTLPTTPPRLVIVDPTPNQTPHPTPPTTPGHRRHHPPSNLHVTSPCTHLGPASLVHSPKATHFPQTNNPLSSSAKRAKPNFSIGSPNSTGGPSPSGSSSSSSTGSQRPSVSTVAPASSTTTVAQLTVTPEATGLPAPPSPPPPLNPATSSKPPVEQPVNDLHAMEQQLVPKQGGKRMQLASDASDDEDYETTSDASESDWSTDESDSEPPPAQPPAPIARPSAQPTHGHNHSHHNSRSNNLRRTNSQPHHPIPTSSERYAAAKERRKTGSMLNVNGLNSRLAQVQDEKDMFEKKPKRTWSRGGSTGGLSVLMNPPPEVFPEGHPERQKSMDRLARVWSSPAATATPRKPSGLASLALAMTDVPPRPESQPPQAQPQARAPQPPQAGPSRPPPVKRRSLPPPARPPPGLIRKSTVLAPISASISASVTSQSQFQTATASNTGGARRQSSSSTSPNKAKARIPPEEQEYSTDEDDDGQSEDGDNRVELSRSLAQERLMAFMSKGKGKPRQQQQKRSVEPRHGQEPVLASTQAITASPEESTIITNAPAGLSSNAPTPTPVPHSGTSHHIVQGQFPYNLPAPTDPSTPRTTRRLMLRTELSESLRQNLLWTRQQAHGPLSSRPHQLPRPSSTNLNSAQAALRARNPHAADQMLNARHRVKSLVQLTPRRPGEELDPQREEEMKRDREGLLRSRSGFGFAGVAAGGGGDFHLSGW